MRGVLLAWTKNDGREAGMVDAVREMLGLQTESKVPRIPLHTPNAPGLECVGAGLVALRPAARPTLTTPSRPISFPRNPPVYSCTPGSAPYRPGPTIDAHTARQVAPSRFMGYRGSAAHLWCAPPWFSLNLRGLRCNRCPKSAGMAISALKCQPAMALGSALTWQQGPGRPPPRERQQSCCRSRSPPDMQSHTRRATPIGSLACAPWGSRARRDLCQILANKLALAKVKGCSLQLAVSVGPWAAVIHA